MMSPLLYKVCTLERGKLTILDEEKFRRHTISSLAYFAVFATDAEVRDTARYIIRVAARQLGAYPASMDTLYAWIAKRGHLGFTVPAFNVRGLAYDFSRAIFREAIEVNAGPFIFEIARGEMDYSDLWPEEFAPMVLAAAIAENYHGPVFLQADHTQVHADRFFGEKSRDKEMQDIEELITRALANDFYNIDIDASTLVDLSKNSVIEQQRDNIVATDRFAQVVRAHEPSNISVSVGGEVGEIGQSNTTEEELKTFLHGFREIFPHDLRGLSKISVQTGSTHGGVVNPDGSLQKVDIDLHVHHTLSPLARIFGLAGTVQHGASTLPTAMLPEFPANECLEIHLATGLQNIIFHNTDLPQDFRAQITEEQMTMLKNEWKKEWTRDQFLYKTLKKTWGTFKEEWWHLDMSVRESIRKDLRATIKEYFEKLQMHDTRDCIDEHVPKVITDVPQPENLLDI